MELLKRMIDTLAVSGNEEKLTDLIEAEIKPYADEIRRDVLGNLIALKKGTGKAPKKMMLSAHMDEIGMMVTYIDDKGFIHFTNIGGLLLMVLAGTKVIFKNGVKGIVMYHTKVEQKDLKLADFYIDIGASSKEEAESMVSVGDVCGVDGTLHELGKHSWSAKSMDDKIGCYIQIKVLQQIEKPVYDTYFVFSVQEEVGTRGAITSAYQIEPDYAIAVDITGVGDQPKQANPNALSLGGGAAIKIRDNSIVCSRHMINFMTDVAKENKIPFQYEILMYGGTDAGAIHLTKGGVVTGAISVPTRYAHGPSEMVDKRDVEACIKLITAILNKEID